MRTLVLSAAVALVLAANAAAAQDKQAAGGQQAQATPIPGIDEAAIAGSARASKLIGSKIYQGDTSIGQIEDVLVDLGHSSVTGLVVSVGGFLGIGDKLVAVPVGQIKVSSEAKFTSDLTREQLTNAPAYHFASAK